MKSRTGRSRGSLHLTVVGIILLFLITASAAMPTYWNAAADAIGANWLKWSEQGFRLGLDLQGGAQLVYQADMSAIPDAQKGDALQGIRDVIERRVNAFGVSEPVVQTIPDADRIIIELAGIFDVSSAVQEIGETPILEFKIPNANFETEATPEEQKIIDAAQKTERDAALDKLNEALDGDVDDEFVYVGFIDESDPVFDELAKQIKEDDIELGVIDALYESTSSIHVVKLISTNVTDEKWTYEISHIEMPWTTFEDVGNIDPWINTELSGKNVTGATVAQDPNTGAWFVVLNFNAEGGELFATLTEENVGNVIGIFLDGMPISTPVVQEAIYGGEATITGNFTLEEAKIFAQRLNAGALPVPIELISQSTVGPTLGQNSLDKSIDAAIAGFVLIAIFMILYYRLAGFIAVVALCVYAALNLALYKWLGVTMSLASIAGFVLSLGIAMDANVLIFARLKEELNSGRDLPTAIDEGFRRAWTSIRDGNFTTLIAAAVLFTMSTSFIKGFALTLALGVLMSMFTAMFISRILLQWVSSMKPFKSKWLYNGRAAKE